MKNTPYENLKNELIYILKEKNLYEDHLVSEIPKRWLKHDDLILLKENAFISSAWINLGKELWLTVARVLKCSRIAKKGRIFNDEFRSPKIEMVLGSHGWVTHVDNGIKYHYDVTKCMFSPGNITEKLRISKMNCEGEVIVDLYAGIGYFTLPFLVHAKASFVHACEWNPHALEALQRTLDLNGIDKARYAIHAGDNKEVCPADVADRVNLGLIPSSEAGWPVACHALKSSTGGILHIHGNVTGSRDHWDAWTQNVTARVKTLLSDIKGGHWTVAVLHLEHVKPYAPHIEHLVVDVECRPESC